MTRNAAKVLEAAKSLSRTERAEVAQELLSTLDADDVSNEVRLAALRSAVDAAATSLDAGERIAVPTGELREYLRDRGRLATERAAARSR
jgi:hypothetical protein